MKNSYMPILTRFGLSPTSAKVYLALLDLGKSTAIRIAEKAGTYKANVYEALDRLIEKGMVTFIIEDGKKFYLPTNPEKLKSIIEESKQRAVEDYEELKGDVERIMPELLMSYGAAKDKDVFEVYKGRKGFRTLMSEIVKEKPKYWKGFGNLQVQEFFPIDFTKWFKKIEIMLFSIKSNVVLRRLREARKTTKVTIKWLPQEMYMPIVWVVFGDNLLILIYEPDMIALRIKSEQIVRTFSNQFDYLFSL